MQDAEFSEDDVTSHGLRVFGLIDFLRLECRAVWVRFSSARNRRSHVLTGRLHDSPIQAGYHDFVARFCDSVFALCKELGIRGLEKIIRGLSRLHIPAMIDKFF